MNEETKKRVDTEKDLNTIRAELTENRFTLVEKSSKLNSTLEIHRELSNKLKSLTLAKSRNEEHLSKMIRKRGSMIQKIEKLRRQKNVLQRRIEFCRDKDAIEMITRLNKLNFAYKEFTADKIRAGTENFSGHCRIKCSSDLQITNVYRARINQTTIAVKLYGFGIKQLVSQEELDIKVVADKYFRVQNSVGQFMVNALLLLSTHFPLIKQGDQVLTVISQTQKSALREAYKKTRAIRRRLTKHQLRVCHKLTKKLRREIILGSSSLVDPAQFVEKLKSLTPNQNEDGDENEISIDDLDI